MNGYNLNPHERFHIPNYHFYRTNSFTGRNGVIDVAVRKGIPHKHVDLPPLVSVEATGVCIPISNSELLLTALYKSPGRASSDADIIELLSFRRKSILAGDLNAKHTFWNSIFFNPSGVKLLNLLHINDFEISAQQCPTHYSPMGNGDVLDIVHKNVRLSEFIVSDILYSDHIPIIFYLLDHIRSRNLLDPVDEFTDWERFHRLASELISPEIEINSEEEADKVARDFTASIVSAYRIATSNITLLDINKDIPGLENLLKHKRMLRKLWQITRDPS
jgi:hypothetical protein